ncbi:MAG TPA: DNA-binding protein [Spirochaeta sp.]|nr:DNA-binding protein [Spirochaeta sp.]
MLNGTKEWVDFAERDYEASMLLANSHTPSFEIIAYHCQQAAEKYLKAMLIENNKPVPHIHDLGKLNLECSNFQAELSVIQDICERLTPFGTVTRYPGSSMQVGSEHLPLIISWTEEIRKIIRNQLGIS